MTVYHNGVEVEIVAGNFEEGWAAVKYEDGTVQDVGLIELTAEGGSTEIEDAIGEANEDLDVNLNQRIRVRYPNNRLIIETGGNTTLYREDFMETMFEDDDVDDYDFVEKVTMEAVRMVDMTHRQPSRLIYRNRHKFKETAA